MKSLKNRNMIIILISFVLVIMLVADGFFLQKNKENNTDKALEECMDGSCDIPEEDEDGNQIYAISSPVGYHSVEMIKQAKRLDTLNGKKLH